MSSGAGFVPAHLVIEKPGATRTAFVIHGILGSAANWRSFVRRLVDTSSSAAAWRWVLVDLRGHGESTAIGAVEPGAAPRPPHTVAACAADLERLAAALGVDVELVFGHSFGGKVALAFADRHAPARAVWLLDTPPGPVGEAGGSASLDEVARVFEVIGSLPEPLPGRAEVAAAIKAGGLSDGLAQWMTTNVRGTADGYRWKFDLPMVKALVADYAALDLWPRVESPRPGLTVVVVRGGRSARFSPTDVARLEGLGARARVIPEAGHWLHVDAPEALARLFDEAARAT